MITLCAWNVEEDATAASHLTIAHALTPAMYHQRAGLPHDYPLVCVELSREIAKRARANDLGRQGARARKPWNNAKAVSRRRRTNGAILPSAPLVSKAEELVLAALPVRLRTLSSGQAWSWATNLAAQLSRPSWRDGICRASAARLDYKAPCPKWILNRTAGHALTFRKLIAPSGEDEESYATTPVPSLVASWHPSRTNWRLCF